MQQRNIVTCIILSIVTCGIYGIYWYVMINNDTLSLSGEEGTRGGMLVLLTIVTCGIYAIYWNYKQGERIDKIVTSRGGAAGNRAIIYLVLSIFGLSIVAWAMMQNELNQMIPA